MKKILTLFLIIIGINLSACSKDKKDVVDLEKLTDNYSLGQAKSDGCLVMENGDVTSGQEVFDVFFTATENEENATIRVVEYFTIGDKSQYSEELYEQEKDKYPQMYITDVIFENGKYITRSYENNEEQLVTKEYKYMIKDEFSANPKATFTTAIYYILVNDESVTWNDIWEGLISSQFNAGIDHFNIYQKHTYK